MQHSFKQWGTRWLLVLFLGARLPAFAQSPVTDRPVNNADGVFRFAILPDRTGGNRPGVFEDALAKVKLLQPEFVMSTGDLIDGYTTDEQVWTAQWQQFDALVNQLDMPFHYVPGNHDTSNPLMVGAWKKLHGGPWSSFVYKNVLFLSLFTEDRPFGGLGPEQIAWVKQTLTQHADVRWTLLFFHRPLWREKNQAGFEQVREALKGRKYTVFAGHYHHYLKGEYDGMKYYVLATVGGGSSVRGPEFGEFDHVTWVTMKPDGPVVANLQLSGIVPDDIVTEETYPRIQALREGSWLHVTPVVQDTPDFKRLTLSVELLNPTDYPLRVRGSLTPGGGMRFAPARIDRVVAPHQNDTVSVALVGPTPETSIHTCNESLLKITLTGSYEVGGKTLELPATQPVELDWIHSTPLAPQPVVLDGNLAEWPAELFTHVDHPMYIKEEWDWNGPKDGSFRFAVQQRDGKVFVAIETVDDHVIVAADPAALQDKLFVQLRTTAGSETFEGVAGTNNPTTFVSATATGLVGEFALPLPAEVHSFHLNIGWQDHDRPENTKPSVLWWRDPKVEQFGEFTLTP